MNENQRLTDYVKAVTELSKKYGVQYVPVLVTRTYPDGTSIPFPDFEPVLIKDWKPPVEDEPKGK